MMRKAAELVVELPPEEPPNSEETLPNPMGTVASSATDKMWAELERAAQNRPQTPPESPPTKTVEQIVREEPGPNLDQIKVTSAPLPQVVAADGTINYAAIYQAANLPAVPFTAEQVLEMITALPTELPLEIKRQTLRVSINAIGKTIGATPENIVADASRKLAALAAYTEHLSQLTGEFTSKAELKIAGLQAQIEETRKAISAAQQKQAQETQACTNESNRLDDVLEFFSMDVPPSKYAPPKDSTT
jgi:acyl transferase domain-containing protein